ncbi:MAG TPA: hypothetical protein VGM10_25105 [Actinocrinis sp.]
MPASRPRKKKSPHPGPARQGATIHLWREPPAARPAQTDELAELIETLDGMGSHRRRIDTHRRRIAATRAGALLPGLLELAAGPGGAEFEDAVCERLGGLMYELAEARSADDRVSPGQAIDAVLIASADGVRRALNGPDAEPDRWRPAWRLLSALARIASHPHDERAHELIAKLRARRGGEVLPEFEACEVAGPALWTRDCYGSRFAVVVPFRSASPSQSAERSQRWYLWDVDACAFVHFTVYSGYFASAEEAVAAWKAGVGSAASADSVLTPVDDAGFMVRLLPARRSEMAPDGESAQQLAEYHRCRRLADTLREELGRPGDSPEPWMPNPAEFGRQFTEWRTKRLGSGAAPPPDPEDAVAELAHNWCDEEMHDIRAGTCSPHRIAHFAAHLRLLYEQDFCDQLMALLPDWVAWWTGVLGLPDHLAARCQPYAAGAPHPARGPRGHGLNRLARVEE